MHPTFHTNAYHKAYYKAIPNTYYNTTLKHNTSHSTHPLCYPFVKPSCPHRPHLSYAHQSYDCDTCNDNTLLTSQHNPCPAVLLAPSPPSYKNHLLCHVNSLLPTANTERYVGLPDCACQEERYERYEHSMHPY